MSGLKKGNFRGNENVDDGFRMLEKLLDLEEDFRCYLKTEKNGLNSFNFHNYKNHGFLITSD